MKLNSQKERLIVENRYGQALRDENQKILQLLPAVPTLRTIMANEFKKLWHQGTRVLEIGCGEGDSAEPLLRETNGEMHLLDESPEMVQSATWRLASFADRVKYITADALGYLESAEPYDYILSSWTIHNFPWNEKMKLFSAIHENLTPTGAFLLMDKVYPEREKKHLLDIQLRRYRCLSPEGCQEITLHERMDFTKKYRMDEPRLLKVLHSVGFRTRIVDRVERDVVIVAKK